MSTFPFKTAVKADEVSISHNDYTLYWHISPWRIYAYIISNIIYVYNTIAYMQGPYTLPEVVGQLLAPVPRLTYIPSLRRA